MKTQQREWLPELREEGNEPMGHCVWIPTCGTFTNPKCCMQAFPLRCRSQHPHRLELSHHRTLKVLETGPSWLKACGLPHPVLKNKTAQGNHDFLATRHSLWLLHEHQKGKMRTRNDTQTLC